MNCPKCKAEMEAVHHGDIKVDRCTSCRGLWFDVMEHERLAGMPDSERIDDGDAAVGKSMDLVDRIDCPTCASPMIRMVDRDQPHIRYESCTVCHGVFFDAGEFRDYKEHGVLDFIEDALTPQRD